MAEGGLARYFAKTRRHTEEQTAHRARNGTVKLQHGREIPTARGEKTEGDKEGVSDNQTGPTWLRTRGVAPVRWKGTGKRGSKKGQISGGITE